MPLACAQAAQQHDAPCLAVVYGSVVPSVADAANLWLCHLQLYEELTSSPWQASPRRKLFPDSPDTTPGLQRKVCAQITHAKHWQVSWQDEDADDMNAAHVSACDSITDAAQLHHAVAMPMPP